MRNTKIIATVSMIYSNSVFSLRLDESYSNLEENEEIIAEANQILLITDKEWNLLKNEKDSNDLVINSQSKKNDSKPKNVKKILKNLI